MADRSITISIRNSTSSALTLVSYNPPQGDWDIIPRDKIPPGETDTFKLGSSDSGVSEGDVTYGTTSGTQFKVSFKCAVGGNTLTATPGAMASVTYNAAGSPLNATVIVLEA
ncbi:hypothetical protein PsYK624_160080 [Phanerochaete sordida]|uniref:Uncharacterized protein n=1 Tax=Phanerochaete sordida TaxID=48140 RepID=A0A9P3GQ68_9APHY|nr:hypothetical protein PsYK624_160080 [Phanerochaete sordida]